MANASNMMAFVTRGAMSMDRDWSAITKGLLRSEMTRRGVSYKDLAEKLKTLGADENEANLRNKVSRGGFSAVFLVQCLSAMGCHTLRLSED